VRTVPNANRMIRIFLAALLGAVLVATAASGQEKVKFPIGVGTKTLGTSMYWLANKKGFFDEVGLEVQLVLLRGSTITIQALRANPCTLRTAQPIQR
jgi:ABC-type nitrate/sulfonate/bicarbonate transport system substrate-binding protein